MIRFPTNATQNIFLKLIPSVQKGHTARTFELLRAGAGCCLSTILLIELLQAYNFNDGSKGLEELDDLLEVTKLHFLYHKTAR